MFVAAGWSKADISRAIYEKTRRTLAWNKQNDWKVEGRMERGGEVLLGAMRTRSWPSLAARTNSWSPSAAARPETSRCSCAITPRSSSRCPGRSGDARSRAAWSRRWSHLRLMLEADGYGLAIRDAAGEPPHPRDHRWKSGRLRGLPSCRSRSWKSMSRAALVKLPEAAGRRHRALVYPERMSPTRRRVFEGRTENPPQPDAPHRHPPADPRPRPGCGQYRFGGRKVRRCGSRRLDGWSEEPGGRLGRVGTAAGPPGGAVERLVQACGREPAGAGGDLDRADRGDDDPPVGFEQRPTE